MKVTTMNVSLPIELARFVRARVKDGHYSTVSEVIREALRLLAAQESSRPQSRRGLVTALSGEPYDQKKAEQAVAEIRELSERCRLGGLTIEDLINEGREH